MVSPAIERESIIGSQERATLKTEILRVLETNRLACEYQPIKEVQSGATRGYEALARFTVDGHAVAPDRVFGSLHDDRALFFMLESRSKRFQILHRPTDAPLFVNLNPHVCEEPYQLDHWFEELGRHSGVVVEIIENTTITNLESIRGFTRRLCDAGIRVALDDIGGYENLFSFELLESCHYIKLDRRWFMRLRADAAYRRIVEGLVKFANERGIQTILEGVERVKDLHLARDLGVDLVQGFFFADDFVSIEGVDGGDAVE